MTTVSQLTQALQEVFTTTADALARRTGFVQRASKLTGALFAQTLVFGWLANPQASLEGLAPVAAAVGVTIRAQSLDERFTEAAAVFMDDLLARGADGDCGRPRCHSPAGALQGRGALGLLDHRPARGARAVVAGLQRGHGGAQAARAL